MADNNRGSGEAFRRRQEARKRREPQTIDAKAEDVTTSPLAEPPYAPSDAAGSPVSETPPPIDPLASVPGAPSLEAAQVGDRAPETHAGGNSLYGDETGRPMGSSSLDGFVDDPALVPPHSDMGPAVPRDDSLATLSTSSTEDPLLSGDAVPMTDFVRPHDGNEHRESALPHGKAFGEGEPETVVVSANDTPLPAEPSHPSHEPIGDEELAAITPPTHGVSAAAPWPDDVAASSDAVRPTEMPQNDIAPSGDAPLAAAPPTHPSDPAAPLPERRRSMLPAALAALALLILAGLAGIYYGLQLGGSAELAAKVDALSQRVASLEARPEPPKPTVDLDALQSRSTTLDADVAALKTAVTDLTGKLDQVTQAAAANAGRLTALEQHAAASPSDTKGTDVAGASSPPPAVPTPATPPTLVTPPEPVPPSADTGSAQGSPAKPTDQTAPAAPVTAAAPSSTGVDNSAELAALTGKIEDLSTRMAALPTEPPPAVDLSPLRDRIAELAKQLEAEQATIAALPKVDEAAIDGRLTGIDRKIDDTGHHIDEVAAVVAALPRLDLAPLQASIADVDKRLAPVEAALAAPKAGDRVTEARAVGSAEESRAAPLAVVAGSIARALDEGRPFGPELDALHGLGIDDAALASLPSLAEPGAPTPGSLRDRWSAIQPKVLTAAGPKTGDSMLDRFAAGARTLVQVRQVGASTDDDPSAASARIGAALDRGDIAEALAEWTKLPEASRTASQSWADAARSRLDADGAVAALMTRAIASLAPVKN